MAKTEDRRAAERQNVVKRSMALYRTDEGMMDAIVLDISTNGAKIRPLGQGTLPHRFALVLPGDECHCCEVVWRNDTYVAVQFDDPL